MIPHPSKDVKVTDTTLLHDQNGDAIVVELKNESNQTLVNVPILVDVKDAEGQVRLQEQHRRPRLRAKPRCADPAGRDLLLGERPAHRRGKDAKVTVGQPEAKAPSGQASRLYGHPAPGPGHDFSGAKVSGTVTNESKSTSTT